jgi:hypothetical protein
LLLDTVFVILKAGHIDEAVALRLTTEAGNIDRCQLPGSKLPRRTNIPEMVPFLDCSKRLLIMMILPKLAIAPPRNIRKTKIAADF